MTSLAQLGCSGVAMIPGGEISARLVFWISAGLWLDIRWVVLATLMLLSAGVGALIGCSYAKRGMKKRVIESAGRELEMLRAVISNMPDPIYVKDVESRFVLANQKTAEVMGAASGAELIGKTDFDFYPAENAAAFVEDERKIIRSGQPLVNKEEGIQKTGGKSIWTLTTKVPLFDPAGSPIGLYGIGRDITALKEVQAELGRARKELEFKVAHDSLTSLLNREAILEMLEHELNRSIRENGHMVVLLGDLDHFKDINDTYGHPVGDEVLREVACRLQRTVRTYDLVGRYGGEEFLIVLPGCKEKTAWARAEQLREAIGASPASTASGPISITLSVGVLDAREWGWPSSAEVLREVDRALYAAKNAGRNCCMLAAPPLQVSA
ncbi:MAG: GGDEF domain-containing protein [Terracidiphilus sp.]